MSTVHCRKIMWLEDDQSTSLILANIEQVGYEVIRAVDISAAIDRVFDEPGLDEFSLLVIDVSVPYNSEHMTKEFLYEVERLGDTGVSGWIWLKQNVLNRAGKIPPIILYSYFNNKIPRDEKRKYKDMVTFIDKNSGSVDELIRAIVRLVPNNVG